MHQCEEYEDSRHHGEQNCDLKLAAQVWLRPSCALPPVPPDKPSLAALPALVVVQPRAATHLSCNFVTATARVALPEDILTGPSTAHYQPNTNCRLYLALSKTKQVAEQSNPGHYVEARHVATCKHAPDSSPPFASNVPHTVATLPAAPMLCALS